MARAAIHQPRDIHEQIVPIVAARAASAAQLAIVLGKLEGLEGDLLMSALAHFNPPGYSSIGLVNTLRWRESGIPSTSGHGTARGVCDFYGALLGDDPKLKITIRIDADARTIAIEPAFAAYLEMLGPSFEGRPADLTEENLQSRIRGTTLMALSNKFGWMVLTTGNKSELAVGYFTVYGDSVGGYAVIKDLLKMRVYDLCRYVNQREGKAVVNESVLTKAPSAELRPDQRDDQSLPAYEVLDPILQLYVEDDRTAAEIIELGHPADVVRRIARLVDLNEYKRRQCPPGVKVSTKAFGKDRRLPITNGYRQGRDARA